MSSKVTRLTLSAAVIVCLLFSAGCGRRRRSVVQPEPLNISNDTTIGSLAEVFAPGAVAVEGYGVVGSLRGSGSSECPPEIRDYLRQYILKQSPEIRVGSFLNSNDTAVVTVEGVMPAGAYKGQIFDIRARALTGTQTTSLREGWLYKSELQLVGRFEATLLGRSEGPIYIDTLGESVSDETEGYVLGGGKVLEEFDITISLLKPDFRLAGLIRDRLNARFGGGTATAVSDGQIIVDVPAEYRRDKLKFAALLRSIYIVQSRDVVQEHIIELIGQLAGSPNKELSEIALEAIGRLSLVKLEPLLRSNDEEVKFLAARCMLNLGSDKGLEALREVARNQDSVYRIEALEAVVRSEWRQEGASLARLLLREDDIDVKLAAYKNLVALDDIAIISESVGRKFYMDQITQSDNRLIYVSRSGEPRIALFGAPLYCRRNIFIESENGEITINAAAGQEEVTIILKISGRRNVPPIRLNTSYDVSDIIRALAEEPVSNIRGIRPGLNISYGEVISLVKQLCEKGVITAKFRAGPLPEIGL